jgi:DNA-binding MarR family transcriptional regulator
MIDPFAHAADTLIEQFPRVFFACHRRHRRDPASGRVLSESLVRVLDHLDEVEATSLTGLSRHMGLTPGTLSAAVSRLVRRGYVRRRRDALDQRRVGLRLTAAGARVKEAQSVLDRDLVEVLLRAMSAEEIVRAMDGLRVLAEATRRIDRGIRAEQAPSRMRATRRAGVKEYDS